MAKQKGGLHKQVDSIFGGSSVGLDDSSNDQPEQRKSSFPGKLPVSVSENENDAPNVQPQKIESQENTQDTQEDNIISPPKVDPPKPEVGVVQKKDIDPVQKKDQGQPKKVMLPAALTAKPSLGFVDRMKVKIDAYVEENGKKQLYLMFAIPVLALALVFFMWKNLFPSSSNPAVNNTQTGQIAINLASTSKDLTWEKPEMFPANMRDPMRKARVAKANSSTDFDINGIVYMENEPEKSSALVGKMAVYIGDTINGATVVDIQPKYVEFEIDGEKVKQGVGGKY